MFDIKGPTYLRISVLIPVVLAGLLALFYITIAMTGGVRELVQMFLAIGFIPVLAIHTTRPVMSAIFTLGLLYAWAVNFILAMPDNLGFNPFAILVLFSVYSITKVPRCRLVKAFFFGFLLVYCYFSPVMWTLGDHGMTRIPQDQGISWLLIQWLIILVIVQVAREKRRDEEAKEAEYKAREQVTAELHASIRDRERLVTAREIHDILAHSLTLINVQASAGKTLLKNNNDHVDVREILENIHNISARSLDEVRGVIRMLRTDMSVTLEAETTKLAALPVWITAFQDAGLTISINVDDSDFKFLSANAPTLVQLACRRIIDESLTNVMRHQGINSQVNINLCFNKEKHNLALAIKSYGSDSGTMSSAIAHAGSGSGLIGMRERVESLGGNIECQQSGDFFLVTVELPL